MAAERIKPRNQVEREQTDDTIAELETGLRIDKNGLDDALEQQPDFFYRVSKQLVLENSKRDALKQEAAELEAEMDEKVRAHAEHAKIKLTETEAKMQVRLEPKVKGINQDLLRANRRCADLGALKEAFTQRSYAIKELVSLYVANYYGDNTGGRQASDIKTRDAQHARREMTRDRRDRDRS